MNLFEKQQKPFAIKLSDRVKEEIKKTFRSDWYDKASEKGYFHYPNFENYKGFKEFKHTSIGIEYGYTLITEAEFFGEEDAVVVNKLNSKIKRVISLNRINFKNDLDTLVELEQITDDFAVKFAEFYLKVIDDGDEWDLPIIKLLQIFKNNNYE